MLGDADAVGARRIDHQDAAGAGGGDVDVVDAGAGARDDAELGRRVHQRGGHLGGATDEDAVGIRQIEGEGVGLAARARVHHPAGLGAQQVQRGGWQVVGDNDFQWAPVFGPMLRT